MLTHSQDEVLAAVAFRVVQSVGQRTFDGHHVLGEGLVTHLVSHELLSHSPALKPRLWLDYRPWPEESGESIRFWIEGLADQSPIAIDIHVDDPTDESRSESSGVWGKIIADVLKLATAIACRNLGRGYIMLFGELQHDPSDQRIDHIPLNEIGELRSIATDALVAHKVMDEGFFEELMHPREVTPRKVEIKLLTCDSSQPIGFWLWAVDLPDSTTQ